MRRRSAPIALAATLALSSPLGACVVYDPALVALAGDAGSQLDARVREDAGARSDASAPDSGAPEDVDAGTPEPTLAVLTLNLRCLSLEGTPYATQLDRFAAVAATVVAERVDVLALQEVCEDGTVDVLALLIDALEAESGEGWSGHAVFAHVAGEGTPDEADERVAIVARSIRATGELVHRRQGVLRRAAATAEVGIAGGTVHVISVHLDHLDADAREAQAREAALSAMVEADPSLALIVAGDFNDREGQPAHTALLAAGFRDRSAGVGLSRIDHVFVHRGSGLVTREARALFDTPETAVSDHPGVLVRLSRATPEAVLVSRVTAEHTPPGGRTLWIRGSQAPLSWTSGWPMHPIAPGRWRWVSTELSGPFELKAILDDDETSWQRGANTPATAGVDLEYRPTF